MSLVKWFRKNNKKVMAVVVIVLMFGFIGGSSLTYLSQRSTGKHKTVAYFLKKKKITSLQLALAQQDLEILRMLRADRLLQNQPLTGILLGELLFSEQRVSPALVNHIRRTIGTSGYRISEKQIADIYRRPMLGNIYWLLLTTEARLAGIRVSTEDVGRLLTRMAPQLFDGVTYTQLMRTLVNRNAVSEKRILTTFARLLAVLQYANLICSAEDVTSPQIVHAASHENETIDIEFVQFDSAVFAETQPPPDDRKMIEHLDKYKQFLAGAVTEVFVDAAAPGGAPPYGIVWTTPGRGAVGKTASILVDEPGTYTVTATGANGCWASESVIVEQNIAPPVVDVGTDQMLTLHTREVTLTAVVSGCDGPCTLVWKNMLDEVVGTTASITVSRPGLYYAIATNSVTGCSATDEVAVGSDTVSEVLLESTIEGLAVFGQLTKDGVPIPGTVFQFQVGSNVSPTEGAEISTVAMTGTAGTGYEANGAEINYIIPTNAIVRFTIHKDQFIFGKKYYLLHLPTDPEGNAAVAFF